MGLNYLIFVAMKLIEMLQIVIWPNISEFSTCQCNFTPRVPTKNELVNLLQNLGLNPRFNVC